MKWILLAFLMCASAWAQSADSSPGIPAPELQDAINRLGPGPVDVKVKLGKPKNAGLCEISFDLTDQSTGATRNVKLARTIALECNEINVEARGSPIYVKITIKPKDPPPGGPSPGDLNPWSPLKDLYDYYTTNNNKPPGSKSPPVTIAPATASQRTASAIPEVLDLPFAPPFSQGRDLDALDGCDPARPPTIFRVNHYADTVSRVDGCDPASVVTIHVASRPLQGALTPDAKTLIVASFDNAISFIDTATNRVTKTLNTPNDFYPGGIDITRDGQGAFVLSFDDVRPQIAAIDIATQTIIARFPLPYEYPNGIFLTPDGTQAYITHPFGSQVAIFDLMTASVAATLPVAEPHAVAFNRTGTRAYISGVGVVRVFDTSTMQQIDAFTIAGEPSNLGLSDNGQLLYIEDYASTKLYVLELATRTLRTIETGSQSPGVALN